MGMPWHAFSGKNVLSKSIIVIFTTKNGDYPALYLDDLGLNNEQLNRVKARVNHVHQSNLATVELGFGRLQDAFLHV